MSKFIGQKVITRGDKQEEIKEWLSNKKKFLRNLIEDVTGYGYGYINKEGIKIINNKTIYKIDNINTIIYSIKNNIARGAILNRDLTLKDCYIVKSNKFFAHGSSIKEAMKSLQYKELLDSPIEDRIKAFILEFPLFDKKYKANDLFDWHYRLTGSCELGRKSFIDNNNIDLKKDKFTINEFINLTKNEYQGDIIKQVLRSFYETNNNVRYSRSSKTRRCY